MAKVSEFAQQSFLEELDRPDHKVEAKVLSIGATLRTARQKRGATPVEKIAREICAWPYHVKAIENDQFDLLPGTTYAIGFIRAYANYLGLDGAALVQRFKEETAPEPQAPKQETLETLDGPHMPGWAMAATVLILLVGTYATWLGLVRETTAPAPAPAVVHPAYVAEAAPPVTPMPPLALVAQPPMALARNPSVADAAPAVQEQPRHQHRRAPAAEEAPKTLPSQQKPLEAIRPVRLRSVSYTRREAPPLDVPVGTLLPLNDNLRQNGSQPLLHNVSNGGAFNLLVKNPSDAVGGGLRRQVSFDPVAFVNRREPVVP